jgi:hypothetical protein
MDPGSFPLVGIDSVLRSHLSGRQIGYSVRMLLGLSNAEQATESSQ